MKDNKSRIEECKKEYIYECGYICNKIIILVDDSVVIGNTIQY